MGILDRFRGRKPGDYSPAEAIVEIERRASKRSLDPESVSHLSGPEHAQQFLTYQVTMDIIGPVLEGNNNATALAMIEYLEQGAYPEVTCHVRGAHAKACALLGLGRNEEALKYFDDCINNEYANDVPEAPFNRALARMADRTTLPARQL